MASNIDPTYFLDLFPEFKGTPNSRIQAYLDIATLRVPQSVWGGVYQYATALLTAHMVSMTANAPGGSGGGGGGALASESVGELSRGYAFVGQAGSGDDALMATRYGMEFVNLRRETIVSAGVMSMGTDTVPPLTNPRF